MTLRIIVSALILVNAPATSPLSFYAFGAYCVSGTIEVGKISRNKILIGLARSHRQRHVNVISILGYIGSIVNRWSWTGQTVQRHSSIYGIGIAKDALVFSSNGQFWQSPYG